MPHETSKEEIACRYCGEMLLNSYWLIQHITTFCPVLHPPGGNWPRPEHHHHHHHPEQFGFTFTVPIPQGRKKFQFQMATFIMRDSDPPASALAVLLDADRQPTTPDVPVGQPGGPVWAEDSGGTVIVLTSTPDGLGASFAPVGTGTSNYTWTTTLNNGVILLGTGSVQVNPGEAVSVEITVTAGTPVAPATP